MKRKRIQILDQAQLIRALKPIYLTMQLKGRTSLEDENYKTQMIINIINSLQSTSLFFEQLIKVVHYNRAIHAAIGAELKSFIPGYSREAMVNFCKKIDEKIQTRQERQRGATALKVLGKHVHPINKLKDWLSEKQIKEFAHKIYKMRGSPTWGKRKITGVHIGLPIFRRERITGLITRWIGICDYVWYATKPPGEKIPLDDPNTFMWRRRFIVVALNNKNMIGPNGYEMKDGVWNKPLPDKP